MWREALLAESGENRVLIIYSQELIGADAQADMWKMRQDMIMPTPTHRPGKSVVTRMRSITSMCAAGGLQIGRFQQSLMRA